MSYVVLARKWRPQRFEDLVGQDHVARTLGNAISSGRVAHAFLFTGVRGVGKTTSARILAKALNCMGKPGTVPEGVDPGPTVTPCLECPACKEITAGNDMDVREIDGASYNGVDEVRKLQDSLPYRPNRDRYKIVIVDEVHMLTAAAWNAFLKTLEEPPPHVKFIFATTEVHKVPITILSRVQRFDFKMISVRTIASRLRYVLEEEKIQADDTSVSLLARQAAGSMRDAMSLLDQVIAFGGDQLVGEDVARVLGVAGRGALLDVARALLDGSADRCLQIVRELAEQGFDIPHLARDLLGLLRDLVVARVSQDPSELLDLSDDERGEVVELARGATESDLLRLHQSFSKSFDEVARGADPRASLEMLLVRLSLRPPLLPVDELLHRLAHLERRLSDPNARPARGDNRPSDAMARRGNEPPRPNDAQRGGASGRERSSPSPRATKSDDDSSSDGGPPAWLDEPETEARAPAHAAPVSAPAPASVSAPSPAVASPQRDSAPQRAPASSPSAPASSEVSLSGSRSSAPFEPYVLPEEDKQMIQKVFPVSQRLRDSNVELAALFEQGVPLRIEGQTLELGFEPDFVFEKRVREASTVTLLEEALRAEWGPEASLQIRFAVKEATPARSLSSLRSRERKARQDAAIDEVRKHPRVQEAVRILSAELKAVRIPEV